MKSVYAVAYMTETLDRKRDLYVETLIAADMNEAVGMSMTEFLGNEIMSKGEKIIMVNVAEQDNYDIEEMLRENDIATEGSHREGEEQKP